MTAFSYPKTRRTRNQAPPRFADYRSFKPFLRSEFDGRCVYCCEPDAIKRSETFGVDHYRPKSVFPDLATEYLNLFYCCNACNRRKGAYWPSAANEATHFIPNPCEHEMFAHLRYDNGAVVAKTRAGAVTVELLALNADEAVKWRRSILKVVAAFRARERGVTTREQALQARLRGGLVSAENCAAGLQILADKRRDIAETLATFGELPSA